MVINSSSSPVETPLAAIGVSAAGVVSPKIVKTSDMAKGRPGVDDGLGKVGGNKLFGSGSRSTICVVLTSSSAIEKTSSAHNLSAL